MALGAASWLEVSPRSLPGFRDSARHWAGGSERLTVRGVRFDPVFARGLVLEDVRIVLDELELQLPHVGVRPDLGALLRGRFEPVFSARRFGVSLDAADGLEALEVMRRVLARVVWPGTPFALRDGEVFDARGRRLLEDASLELRRTNEAPLVTLRARQGRQGHVEAHAHLAQGARPTRVNVYLDTAEIADLRRWLVRSTGRRPAFFAAAAMPAHVSGHAYLRFETDGDTVHQLDLTLESAPPTGGPRLRARVTGLLVRSEPRAALAADARGSRAESRDEGWVRVDARAGRIRTLAVSPAVGDRLMVSGRFGARIELGEGARSSGLEVKLTLDESHLALGRWLRKPSGIPARLRVSRGLEPEPDAVHAELEVADVRARAKWDRERGLRGQTDWMSVAELRPLSPLLAAFAGGGALRVHLHHPEDAAPERWNVELDGVELESEHLPARVDSVTGTAEIVAGKRLVAQGLRARIAATPVILDLEAERLGGATRGPRYRMRFHARAPELAVPASSVPDEAVPDPPAAEAGGGLPPVLRAALEKPLELLWQERARLADLEITDGRIEVDRVVGIGGPIRDLRVHLALRARRLELSRVSFRTPEGPRRFRGYVDLNPLVPQMEFVARPPDLAAREAAR